MSFLKNNKTFLIVLLLILFSLPSLFSLFHPGFFQTDDGEWMIIRFSAFHQALRDGQIPVRFLGRLNFGYGYPVANFLYPGFMYLAEPIHLLGFGFVETIKIIFGLTMVGSLIFTFFWLGRIFNKWSAFIGSLFYLYMPYHLLDLYKRGSIGELLSLMILPFILWQVERKSIFWTSLGIGFLIISHNTLAFLFLPIIFLYSILRFYRLFSCLLPIIAGLGLSSFFWIPAVFELSYTKFSNIEVSTVTSYFASVNLIGISTIAILSFASFFIFDILKNKNGLNLWVSKLFIFMLLLSFSSIFFASKTSSFFWNFIPSSLIQFPFRVLSYLPFSIAFLTAYSFSRLSKNRHFLISAILIIILFFSAYPSLKPDVFFDKGEGFYSTNEGTTTVQDEYLPRWVKDKPTTHYKDKIEVISGDSQIKNATFNSKNIKFNTLSLAESKIRINTIYYPGWKAYIDGKESEIKYTNDQGVMDLFIEKGDHNVKFVFSETPLRLFADVVSILSFIVLIALMKFKYGNFKK